MPLPITTLLVALSLQLPAEEALTIYVAPPAYGLEVITLPDRGKKKKKARKERKVRRVPDRSRGSRSVRKYRMLNHKLRPIKYRFRKPQTSRIRGGRYSRQ